MAFSTVTLTHTYQGLDGTPATGSVTFTLLGDMANGGVTVSSGNPVVLDLDEDGSFSVTLPANDDPATLPQGVLYVVTEAIDGAAQQSYSIIVPSASAGLTIDLGLLLPQGLTGAPTLLNGPYVLLADMKQVIGWPTEDTSKDWILNRLIAGACEQVARFCDRPIVKTLYGPPYYRFSWRGNGQGTIILPKYPVLDVVEVIEYQANNPVVLAEIDPSSGGDGYVMDYARGILQRVTGGIYQRPGLPGLQNVLVTWHAGYVPTPNDVVMLTVELIRSRFNNTVLGTQSAQDDDPLLPSGTYMGLPKWVQSALQAYGSVSVA